MTATTKEQPTADTRYVKQGAPQGDFAAGERTKPSVPEIDDFASGEHALPASTAAGDFASGEHTLPTSPEVGDFASGEHALPASPENPDLVDTLPPVLVVPDKKE